ncbi:hypothetical protein D2T30_04690 [Sinirhodobacter populi]|uniref:Uncharacterized protein n=3 Tax=Paenirhodobacter populi TaxID=2306993 RepID=A0A443JRN9_9RHOB|nr:hypothetical protein D2T30_04690 [Sinirhodobacter populi]
MTRSEATKTAGKWAESRGTACHFRGTPCHGRFAPLKLLENSFQGSPTAPNGYKPFRMNGLWPMQHLLRQVWSFSSGWHIEDGLQRTCALLPAGAGGCLLALCLATSAVAEGWTWGSSFDPKPAARREAMPGSSFSGLRVASSFDQPGAGFALAPQGGGAFRLPGGNDALVKLQALIQHAESRRAGYDAWHESAAVPPPKAPSRMTLAEIRSWIAATPGQHHAIGRYQIVPDTLENLIRRTGLPAETLFDAKIQDALANILILDAGYAEFAAGRITPGRFMDNLARIWAGLPLESGLSAYHGVAGNKATVTRAFFAGQMAEIFPQQRAQVQLPDRQAGGS